MPGRRGPTQRRALGRPARLYVMAGIPGSGKSTYAREQLGHCARVSFDDLRRMMSGTDYALDYEPMVIEAQDGDVQICPGQVDRPDATLSGPPPVLLALFSGELNLAQARRQGLRYKGDAAILEHKIMAGNSAGRIAE